MRQMRILQAVACCALAAFGFARAHPYQGVYTPVAINTKLGQVVGLESSDGYRVRADFLRTCLLGARRARRESATA